MPSNSWQSALITQQGQGTALSNTVTATSLLNGQAKFTIPAQAFAVAGAKMKVYASGRVSTAASAPGTLTFAVLFGSIAVFSGVTPTLAVSQTNASWKFEAQLTANSVGNGTIASLYGIAEFISSATSGVILLPATSPTVGAGFDSTVSSLVDFYATWSVASSSNSIRCDDYELTSCN